jgi:CO/xanthine dehydrogenase FAD-binding subunit
VDLNSVEAVIPTADPSQWQPGDAWLAGGTVLFSDAVPAVGNQPPKRLLDLGTAGWPSISLTEEGIELAATCTVAELYDLPVAVSKARELDALSHDESATTTATGLADWPALALIRPCCDSFVASFKVWNMSTVGGNLCTALPAGPMISLCAALDGVATVLTAGGVSRTVPVAEFVTGDGQNCLTPGELLRSISLPSAALRSRAAFRRLSLSNLGRSAVLLIGRLDADAGFVLTVSAATTRPVQLRFGTGSGVPAAAELQSAIDDAVPDRLYHDDVHGLPVWRKDMTYRLAEEIRVELGAVPGERDQPYVSGDFWPPARAQGGW